MDQAAVAQGQTPGAHQRDGTSERRSSPRFALVMQGTVEHAKLVGAGRIAVVASNLGDAGLLLHTDAADLIGEHDLMLVSLVPPLGGDPVLLSVRVLWVKPDLSKTLGRTSFGCAFVDVPPARIAALLDLARETSMLRGIEEPY